MVIHPAIYLQNNFCFLFAMVFPKWRDSWMHILTSSQDQKHNKFRIFICFNFCLGWLIMSQQKALKNLQTHQKKNQHTQQNEQSMDTSWKLECLCNLDIYNRNSSRKQAKTHGYCIYSIPRNFQYSTDEKKLDHIFVGGERRLVTTARMSLLWCLVKQDSSILLSSSWSALEKQLQNFQQLPPHFLFLLWTKVQKIIHSQYS